MVKARKKLSKSAWILIAFLIIGAIALVVAAVLGAISLAFLTDAMVNLAMWESLSWVNVAITIVIPFVAGMAVFYWLKAYIIGEEQVMIGTGISSGYNPTPSTPSVAQQKDEVEIS